MNFPVNGNLPTILIVLNYFDILYTLTNDSIVAAICRFWKQYYKKSELVEHQADLDPSP